MPRKTVSAIKEWINTMGFKLTKSYSLSNKALKINYYNLGNFGVYEEIFNMDSAAKERKFISWTPWGEDFEVTSVSDLYKAYQDSLKYNPELS